ncbi:MAG: hypothetical protein M5U28_40800 [Sandaracinaceae bacterium]|nr:hypothetical protein [Sandaracinaceae bacterium]
MRRELQGLLSAADADVAEVRRIEAGHRQDLDAAHQAGLELNLREIEYQRLNRERENNAKLYNLVLERRTETELTQRHQATHVRVLDSALESRAPISPRFTINAAAGLGAGLALGLALAFLLSRLDRRLKSVADVEQTGLTVLGILPRIEGGRGRAARLRPQERQAAQARAHAGCRLTRSLRAHAPDERGRRVLPHHPH